MERESEGACVAAWHQQRVTLVAFLCLEPLSLVFFSQYLITNQYVSMTHYKPKCSALPGCLLCGYTMEKTNMDLTTIGEMATRSSVPRPTFSPSPWGFDTHSCSLP